KNHPPHIPTGTAGYEVFTFYPTIEEFKDFKGYVQKIEAIGAHRRSGICKIVAPEGWTPRPSKTKYNYKDEQVEHFIIQSPVKESVARTSDAILKSNHVYKKCMTASEYRKMAQSSKYRNPHPELKGRDMETFYFKQMFNSHPIYGADTEGSFYDEGVDEFNMKKLHTILDETKDASGKVIKGVNSVYLYFGMYGASFAWHVEDMELYSINFLHHGSPKYWFAIPPEASPRFERLMRQQFPLYDRQCKAFMRHKSFIVLPYLLDMHRIPYGTMIQYPNEFIITFPHGYHMGWNLGYNIAESTNFATDRWIDFGKNAVLCKCRPDMVEIDMTPFMRKYRRDSFDKWYSYWYLPKPTVIMHETAPKKKKKRLDDSVNEGFTVDVKRRRVGEKAMLWSNEPVNFFAERTFNQSSSQFWPHCAVCQYFQPLHMAAFCREVPKRRTVFNDANKPSCCYTHPPSKQTSLSGIFNYLPRDYVFAMGDDYESSRFQCDLCGNSREGLVRCSACDEDVDPVLAHATCARQAGFLFERRTFPQVTVMICDRHQKAGVEPLTDVNLGDTVIAWLDGGERVERGKVDRLVLRTLITIDFEDDSVSENTLPSDIVQCGCVQRQGCAYGQHQPGSRSVEYTVVFADGSSARLPRADLYGSRDAVPPEVRRRLRK
ncbi:unnamed protein product, partial [Nippostrongylus brasiliensis]|uniref:Lysine-specific demethylase 4 (inferred by orthology to a C. elegans protein) n=1 Tax=Nippostrongylus brasiliensis TaxID=27835 RepID=A0A0N4Y922_NIPBR